MPSLQTTNSTIETSRFGAGYPDSRTLVKSLHPEVLRTLTAVWINPRCDRIKIIGSVLTGHKKYDIIAV